MLALAAMKTGKPAGGSVTREKPSIAFAKRHPALINFKIAPRDARIENATRDPIYLIIDIFLST